MKRKITEASRIQVALFLKNQINHIIYFPPIKSKKLNESSLSKVLLEKEIDNKLFLVKDQNGNFEVNGIKYKKSEKPTPIIGIKCILKTEEANKKTIGLYALVGNDFYNKDKIIYEISEFPAFTKEQDTSLELLHVIKC